MKTLSPFILVGIILFNSQIISKQVHGYWSYLRRHRAQYCYPECLQFVGGHDHGQFCLQFVWQYYYVERIQPTSIVGPASLLLKVLPLEIATYFVVGPAMQIMPFHLRSVNTIQL